MLLPASDGNRPLTCPSPSGLEVGFFVGAATRARVDVIDFYLALGTGHSDRSRSVRLLHFLMHHQNRA
jgi:hypothetical protein